MNTHPDINRTIRRAQAVYIFDSAQAMLDAMRGPQQHDRHVETWRGHKWLTGRLAMFRRADIAMRAELGLPPRKD